MALMDEFKEEREKMRHRPLKDKIAYFWEYYRLPTIIGLAVLVAVVSFIYGQVTKKQDILYGCILNTFQTNTDFEENLLEHMQYDPDHYQVVLNKTLVYSANMNENSYEKYMVLITLISTNTVDFLTGNEAAMSSLAYNTSFADLREVLPKEVYELCEPYVLYADNYILEYNEEHFDGTEESLITEYPDPRKPETMKDPIPVMIDVTQCPEIMELYGNAKDTSIIMAIPWNPPHPEEMALTLQYLLGE